MNATDKPQNNKEGRVTASIGGKGLSVEIDATGHTLIADEPKSVGGEERGPTPYDLLLAALGACKAMTMRMYADRKGWPLAGATVRLEHARIHAADCEECETQEGKVDRITVRIELEGDLDDEQRARLAEIADRCPIHRTLHSEISVRTTLAAPGAA